MPPKKQLAPLNSAHAAAVLAPLASLADLPDDKALAALQRLPMPRILEVLEQLQSLAAKGDELDATLSRLLAQIAGWLVAQNKPVQPDDGSRQWDQALVARLRVLDRLVAIARKLARVAFAARPRRPASEAHSTWDAGLRFRLLCAGALCIGAVPQVLLAAWHGPRATAQRQQEAARLSAALLPNMLHAVDNILQEVGSADEPGSVGRLLQRGAATSDAKLLAFLHFVGQAAPGMLALTTTAEVGKGGHWHGSVMQALMVLVEANKGPMRSLLAGQPAAGLGLLALALDGMLAAQRQLQMLQALGSGTSPQSQQVAERLRNEQHDRAWRQGVSVCCAEALVPAWRALEQAVRSPSVPYAAQAQQLRERAAAAVQQLQLMLGMHPPGQADAVMAAAVPRVSLVWLGSQLAAGMQHVASKQGSAAPSQQEQPWLWILADAVNACVHSVCSVYPAASSSNNSGGSSSSSSSSAARAAWIYDQLQLVGSTLASCLPPVLEQPVKLPIAHTALHSFCSKALPALADRLPAPGAAQIGALIAASSSAVEAVVRWAARHMQQPEPRTYAHVDKVGSQLRSLKPALRALCALQAAAVAVGQWDSGTAAPAAQPALLGLVRSLAKLVQAAAVPAGLEAAEDPEYPGAARRVLLRAGMLVARALCLLPLTSSAAGEAQQRTKQDRRHLDGTVLVALAAADNLQAAGRLAKRGCPPDCTCSISDTWAATVAAIRAGALAAAGEPASLPGSHASLAAVLGALPSMLEQGDMRVIALDGLTALIPRVPWLAPALCRQSMLSKACNAHEPVGGKDLALAGRLLQAAIAQLASLPAGQLPDAAAAAVVQAEQAVQDVRASLPAELWELRHWSSAEVEAAVAATLAEVPGSSQLPGEPQDVAGMLSDKLVLLGEAATQLGSAVNAAGAALPQQPSPADGAAATEEHQLLAVARALKPLRCAHLGCTNADGDSEADLPCRLCSACRQVRYCSAECAKAAWRQHRPACKLMQSN